MRTDAQDKIIRNDIGAFSANSNLLPGRECSSTLPGAFVCANVIKRIARESTRLDQHDIRAQGVIEINNKKIISARH